MWTGEWESTHLRCEMSPADSDDVQMSKSWSHLELGGCLSCSTALPCGLCHLWAAGTAYRCLSSHRGYACRGDWINHGHIQTLSEQEQIIRTPLCAHHASLEVNNFIAILTASEMMSQES